jgi:hypothetical protein
VLLPSAAARTILARRTSRCCAVGWRSRPASAPAAACRPSRRAVQGQCGQHAEAACGPRPGFQPAAAFGLLARSPEVAGGFVLLVSFLPYPSSAFVPVETMPTWLHGVADNQPVTRSSRPCAACSSASPSVPAP